MKHIPDDHIQTLLQSVRSIGGARKYVSRSQISQNCYTNLKRKGNTHKIVDICNYLKDIGILSSPNDNSSQKRQRGRPALLYKLTKKGLNSIDS